MPKGFAAVGRRLVRVGCPYQSVDLIVPSGSPTGFVGERKLFEDADWHASSIR